MKNKEKYRDEILNYSGDDFCCDFVKVNVLSKYGATCCGDGNCARCGTIRMLWLDEEYIEPEETEVDWSKVAVDTPILVKSHKSEKWVRAHFAEYKDGKVYAWGKGRTRYTADYVACWNYARLAD